MPLFAINGTEYPVEIGSGNTQYEDLAHHERRFSGEMSCDQFGDAARAERIPIIIPPIARASGEALDAILRAPGTVELSGDLIGGTVEVEAQRVRMLEGYEDQDLVSLTFDAVEVTPT